MIGPFFHLAMVAPARQQAFRRSAVAHILFVFLLAMWAEQSTANNTFELVGYAMLGAGIVQGAVLIGWRLTQLPKSQALEFLLTSPLQPKRVFVAESLVGISRFLLVQLAGLIPLSLLMEHGKLVWEDVLLLLLYPMLWGLIAAFSLTVWAYETITVKRWGEVAAGVGVLVYLTVGILAGERLKDWLQGLPPQVATLMIDFFRIMHTHNPFGIMQFWFDSINGVPIVALERALMVGGIGVVLAVGLYIRGMCRLVGHFHDRHYQAIDSSRAAQTASIGDRPLSWWAVKRVMEFSGRVNIWLAGGFCLLYGAYMLAGEHWPVWMGQLVFHMVERVGGAPMLVTGLGLLAAVPAAFQYGLWDSSVQDRCRRLELLLLTDLSGTDYWNAALAAAWRRGRGYMIIGMFLVVVCAISGRVNVPQAFAAVLAMGLLWGVSFTLGFAAFSSGIQANGLGSMLTLGVPSLVVVCIKFNLPIVAGLFPPGAIFLAMVEPLTVTWFLGPTVLAIGAVVLAQKIRHRCEGDLRRWYDLNQGTQTSAV